MSDAALADQYRQLGVLTKMSQPVHLHDVVALLADIPDRGLRRRQVGTVVEQLAADVYEVEFSDDQGRTYATLALSSDRFIVLHYHAAALG
jgi:hypothetical protein